MLRWIKRHGEKLQAYHQSKETGGTLYWSDDDIEFIIDRPLFAYVRYDPGEDTLEGDGS